MHKKPKKTKTKLKTVTSSRYLNPPAALSEASQVYPRDVHELTSLKRSADGSLKIVSHKVLPAMNGTAQVPRPLERSIEDVINSFMEQSDAQGWDQGYAETFMDDAIESEEVTVEKEDNRRVRAPGQGDTALHRWTQEIDGFLRAMVSLEGRPSETVACSQCQVDEGGKYRCLNCDNLGLICQVCMVSSHLNLPLHRIQAWDGDCYSKVSLKEIGHRIQLGHPPGERCPLPQQAWGDDFVVIDVDAVHTVGIDYCSCGASSKSEVEQLLERRLYPATVESPKTAATFRVLEVFELLQYESKVSPFELWKALARLTDNTGLNVVKDRYPAFVRMVHEWRHLKLLKRSGRAHDPDRNASETKEGECAVLCPACPHPGINMPEGWEDEPEETKYIHALNLGLDACFRLKRETVSTDTADPGLSKGFSYYVEQTKFNEHIEKHKDEVEPKSTCSRHDAVNLQDVSPGQGYAATGVATVECARHNMKRPSAVCDLQKGERYCNMDFIVHWGVVIFALTFLKTFIISYDIACQWSIHFIERLKEMGVRSPFLQPGVDIRYVVPKFHLPAHISACQTQFAFMFNWGCGLGDGEAPERGWGDSGPLAPATRKMGPGSRRDVLDFNWGDYNWRKVIDLGPSLLKKMERATSMVAEHVVAHKEMEATLDPTELAKWSKVMENWEKDTSKPNPFVMTVDAPTQYAVRKALADEEARAIAEKRDFSLTNDVSPSVLISRGIDLESEQRALKADMRKTWDHSRDRELTRIQLRCNTLTRKLEAWYTVLQLYIPATYKLRQERVSEKTIPAYDLPLWLPSEIGKKAPVEPRLVEIEYKLRCAQASEALVSLRRHLQRRVTVWDLKKRWARGQGANTRALNLVASVEERITNAKEEYRRARRALLVVGSTMGIKGLETTWLPLLDSDVKSLSNAEPEGVSAGQTTRKLSWIWRHSSVSQDNQTEFESESIKVEWAKSRARAARYQEEIRIVHEEMKRTIRYLSWKSEKWRQRGLEGEKRPGIDSSYASGLKAYAFRQAAISEGLRLKFQRMWSSVESMMATAALECKDSRAFYNRQRERGEGEGSTATDPNIPRSGEGHGGAAQ